MPCPFQLKFKSLERKKAGVGDKNLQTLKMANKRRGCFHETHRRTGPLDQLRRNRFSWSAAVLKASRSNARGTNVMANLQAFCLATLLRLVFDTAALHF